ncbi:MAG: type IV secretory system conjugative DNA transfer family protein [Defluviitaleaceae bacterium]|nr:type IV secretory system conjugative DNA transfer family protein [Defluviitaleaceae bacterium]
MDKSRKIKFAIGGALIVILVLYSVGVASQLIYELLSWLGRGGGFGGFGGLGQELAGLVSDAVGLDVNGVDVSYGIGADVAINTEAEAALSHSHTIGHPLHALSALLNTPYNLYGIVFVGILTGVIIIFLRKNNTVDGIMDNERNLVYSVKGTYGTAGWMTDKELHEELEVTKDLKRVRGTILGEIGSGVDRGKVVCVPEDTMMNRNVAVYGAAGSMKSRAYVRNMVFQSVRRGESLIVTDPKGL